MIFNDKPAEALIKPTGINEEEIRRIKTESGKPVIGYLCCFAPPEIISAAGAIPYRITGEPGGDTSSADAYTEPYGCTYVRNILARAIDGKLDFLDGLIISHSCDMVQRLYGIWTYYHPLPYSYLFNVPHQVTPWAQRFYKRELGFFRESLEKFTGRSVSDEKLRNEIVLQNKNRAIIRALYDLRKESPPRLEGSEMLKLLMAGGTQPSGSFNRLLHEKEAFYAARKPGSGKKPRIMIWGSIMDDPALFEIIEEAGGTIVADDTCIGFRVWEKDVPETADPYDGLTEHYFVNFQCPRTDRGPGVKRFNYLLQRAREYSVDGVVGYCISFCDPHKFDYPDLRDYLKKEGLPLLLIDDNYSFEPAEAIKTRLQAFLEML
ncbi:MAG: 2-hydroxyacyl-CoA dehydratase family protein [Bacillota bacterium]|nr:2-hydroxyacyl-CoA dehydratase family protein [Bacillota bacterium]